MREIFVSLTTVFMVLGLAGCEEPIPPELDSAQLRFQKFSEKVKHQLMTVFNERKLELLDYQAESIAQSDPALKDEIPLTGTIEVKYRGINMDTDKFNRLTFSYKYNKPMRKWLGSDLTIDRRIFEGLNDKEEAFQAILGFQPTTEENE